MIPSLPLSPLYDLAYGVKSMFCISYVLSKPFTRTHVLLSATSFCLPAYLPVYLPSSLPVVLCVKRKQKIRPLPDQLELWVKEHSPIIHLNGASPLPQQGCQHRGLQQNNVGSPDKNIEPGSTVAATHVTSSGKALCWPVKYMQRHNAGTLL